MNNDLQWLKNLYGSQGYVFADIKAEPVFLEEPGKIDLVYHIDEGKQWKVGRIFVHIDGDNPHTRIQTALNRLSFRPGEIVDIREIHTSERRLQASALVPDRSAERHRRRRSPTASAISKPSNWRAKRKTASAARVPMAKSPCSPVAIAGRCPRSTKSVRRGYVPATDGMDVHLEVEDTPHSAAYPPAQVSPAQPFGPPSSAVPPTANPYQKLVVRTQSPYQPPTTNPYAAVAPPARGAARISATAVSVSRGTGRWCRGRSGYLAVFRQAYAATASTAVRPSVRQGPNRRRSATTLSQSSQLKQSNLLSTRRSLRVAARCSLRRRSCRHRQATARSAAGRLARSEHHAVEQSSR